MGLEVLSIGDAYGAGRKEAVKEKVYRSCMECAVTNCMTTARRRTSRIRRVTCKSWLPVGCLLVWREETDETLYPVRKRNGMDG